MEIILPYNYDDYKDTIKKILFLKKNNTRDCLEKTLLCFINKTKLKRFLQIQFYKN